MGPSLARMAPDEPRAALAELRGGGAIGLDFGARRIGIAVSDADCAFAFPAGILERRDPERDIARLTELARERGATRFVIGLPLHMNGREGPEAAATRRFAERLAAHSGLPVEWIDERWTSREAARAQEPAPRASRGKRKRRDLDDLAATLILRAWIDARRAAAGTA